MLHDNEYACTLLRAAAPATLLHQDYSSTYDHFSLSPFLKSRIHIMGRCDVISCSVGLLVFATLTTLQPVGGFGPSPPCNQEPKLCGMCCLEQNLNCPDCSTTPGSCGLQCWVDKTGCTCDAPDSCGVSPSDCDYGPCMDCIYKKAGCQGCSTGTRSSKLLWLH